MTDTSRSNADSGRVATVAAVLATVTAGTGYLRLEASCGVDSLELSEALVTATLWMSSATVVLFTVVLLVMLWLGRLPPGPKRRASLEPMAISVYIMDRLAFALLAPPLAIAAQGLAGLAYMYAWTGMAQTLGLFVVMMSVVGVFVLVSLLFTVCDFLGGIPIVWGRTGVFGDPGNEG